MRMPSKMTTLFNLIHWKKYFSLVFFAFAFAFTSYGQCSMSCDDEIQVSLNNECEAEVTYRMILRDPDNSDLCSPNGPQAYKVVVMDEEGVEIPTSPIITCEYTGRTLLVKVKHWYSGNSCWSKVVVEDKNAPLLACESVDLWCTQNAAPVSEGGVVPVPSMVDACAESCQTLTLTYTDTDSIFYACEDIENGVVGTIDRTWTACDNLGNCRTCVQRITIKTPSFEEIEVPANITLSCGDCDPTDLGCTGIPTINGGSLDNSLCNLQIDYTDAITNMVCEGSYTIERSWAIQNTCTEATHHYTQLIEIVDQTPPVITCVDGATVVATPHQTPNSCLANVIIPGATITDNCSSIENISTITKVYKIDETGKKWLMKREEDANGGFALDLELGHYEVYYQATDACGNVVNNLDNACSFTILDNIPPTPVCNALTKLSLDQDGKGLIYAQSFDNGSYDNCCVESYAVRRLDVEGSVFTDYVEFTCEDAGNEAVMVLLEITDCNGNKAVCTINILIEGGTPPTIVSCADNITVSCSQGLSLEEISSTLLTAPTTTQECGGGTAVAEVALKQDYRNECGVGAVIFEWSVSNGAGVGAETCEQLVSFIDDTPISVIFPPDFVGDACANSMEEMTQEVTGIVLIEGADCETIEVLHSDSEIEGDGSCMRFTRTWVVTNLCGDNETFEHVQVIELRDNAAPVIECNGEFFDICLDGGECSRSFVVDGINVTDCSEVTVRAEWKFTPADVCQGEALTGTIETAQFGFATQAFGPGQLWVDFYATDACGNESACTRRDYTIKDCEAPEVICLPGLTLNLDATGEVEVWANDFHSEIIDNCEDCYGEEYIFSFSQDTSETVRFYGCADLGVKTAQVWITDAYGNQNFCPVTFVIKGEDVCADLGQDTIATPPPSGMAGISGTIYLEGRQTIEAVSVMAENHLAEMMDEQTTDESGTYAFEFQRSSNVVINPNKNDDILNGVTTYDILQLRKHILGYEELDSPYKLIAADINHNNAITTADIVALRKAILQVNRTFENNTSWRFIKADHVFADPKNPFAEEMPEYATISELTQEMQVDFIGIKVGDLNGNAKGKRSLMENTAQARNTKRIAFEVVEKQIAANTVETINFTLTQKDIQALQLTVNFDPSLVDIIEIPVTNQVSTENFGTKFLQRGALTMSWDAPTNTNEFLHFTLKVKAKRTTAVSELFTINSTITPAVAYDGQGDAYGVDLAISANKYDYELLQNQPNPFKQATTIRFTLPAKSQGKLTILDSTGRTLKSIEQSFEKGINEVEVRDLQQMGLLYYQLKTDFGIRTQKMIRQ